MGSGTETVRFCMKAMGRALEFLLAAVTTKLLRDDIRENQRDDEMKEA